VSLIAYSRRFLTPILSALAPLLFAVGVVIVNITERVAVDAETREAISELIRRGYELEKMGRELAYASKGLVSWRADEKWIGDLYEWYRSIMSILHELKLKLEGTNRAKSNMLENIIDTMADLYYIISIAREVIISATAKRASREERITEIIPKLNTQILKERFEEANRSVKCLTGTECLWILGKLKPIEEYTVASMYNDLTACHHRILDYASVLADPETVAVSERVFSSRGNPVLVDGCIKWERVLTELYMHGLVDPSDYHPTVCIVAGNRASIRVGTLSSHATHVELVNGIVRAHYYDVDEAVHEEVMKLAEKLGIRVVEHSPKDYTVLEVPVEKRDLLFKRLIPFISTMDDRIRKPEKWRMLYYDMTFEELARVGEAELAYMAPEEFKRRFGVELDC
jgi:hypothetical protein